MVWPLSPSTFHFNSFDAEYMSLTVSLLLYHMIATTAVYYLDYFRVVCSLIMEISGPLFTSFPHVL